MATVVPVTAVKANPAAPKPATVVTTTTFTPTTTVTNSQANLASDVRNDVSEKETRSITKIVVIIFVLLLLAAGIAIAIWLAIRAKRNNGNTGDIPTSKFIPIKLYTLAAGLPVTLTTAASGSYSSYSQYYLAQATIPAGTVVQVLAQGPNGLVTPASNEIIVNGGTSFLNYTVTASNRSNLLTIILPLTYRGSGVMTPTALVSNGITSYPIQVYYQ